MEIRFMRELPTLVKNEDNKSDWDKIPLGLGVEDVLVRWDVDRAPHILVSGITGSGKTIMQNTVKKYCLDHADRWRFDRIDLRGGISPAVTQLRALYEEMRTRYDGLNSGGLRRFSDLPSKPLSIVIAIDDAYTLLALNEGDHDLHEEAAYLVSRIVRSSSASGMHVLLSTQFPKPSVFGDMLGDNVTARYAVGRMNETASLATLGTNSATRIADHIPGRAILSTNGDEQLLQGYFTEE